MAEIWMLEIVQAGQAGKTGLLFDMHRLRKRVFSDRLGWPVHITPGGLEVDDFDLPETVYLLSLDDDRRVIGNCRVLPGDGPTMIRTIWPQFLEKLDMPRARNVWEVSRFAVDSLKPDKDENRVEALSATRELACGFAELCVLCGVREAFAVYDTRIARVLAQFACRPRAVSPEFPIGECLSRLGAFVMDEDMLFRLRAAAGISRRLVTPGMLPPALQDMAAGAAE